MEQLLPPAEEIKQLLEFVTKTEASDLHLKINYPPFVRIGGHLRMVESPPLPSTEYVDAMVKTLMPLERRHIYDELGSLDFSAQAESGDRFRINIYRSTGEMHVAIRRVQSKIPNFEELRLPDIYRETISKTMDGLILVCGVTGCGKSSTLAAMIDYINMHRSMHIITIEDPIEFSFSPKKCIISQREVGLDVPSFSDALRFVVRQDPDVVMIGEMRDRETMLAALQAAETGHLVMGSLHCSDVQQSFARILEFFPRNEHAFIRSSMANSLEALMCQRLIPGIVEGTRFPATEVLLSNSIVEDKILHEEDEDIPAILNQCREEGMRSFTQSLCELVKAEKISREVAMDYAPHREALLSALKGIETSGQSLISRIRS